MYWLVCTFLELMFSQQGNSLLLESVFPILPLARSNGTLCKKILFLVIFSHRRGFRDIKRNAFMPCLIFWEKFKRSFRYSLSGLFGFFPSSWLFLYDLWYYSQKTCKNVHGKSWFETWWGYFPCWHEVKEIPSAFICIFSCTAAVIYNLTSEPSTLGLCPRNISPLPLFGVFLSCKFFSLCLYLAASWKFLLKRSLFIYNFFPLQCWFLFKFTASYCFMLGKSEHTWKTKKFHVK